MVESVPRYQSVLVVDDDDLMRTVMSRALEDDGFIVVTATDGVDALKVLEGRKSVDAMVIDLRMPHMDGRTLAAHLAEHHVLPPVLFVSGYDPTGESGIPGPFLAKPFRPTELARRLRQLLNLSA